MRVHKVYNSFLLSVIYRIPLYEEIINQKDIQIFIFDAPFPNDNV